MTKIFITSGESSASFEERCSFIEMYLRKGKFMQDVFVPSSGPEDWRDLLASPEKHWQCGKSAKALAYCWENCEGFPLEVEMILKQSNAFDRIELLLAFPEWVVKLPGRGRQSYNDIWALAKVPNGLVSIAVEGKVDEPFDKTLGQWKKNASQGKLKRLKYLISCLGLNAEPPSHVRYQLLHRTASAAIMAERFGASAAVMLVQSFSPTDKGFDDFCEFSSHCFGIKVKTGSLEIVRIKGGLALHIGWVRGIRACRCGSVGKGSSDRQ